MYSQENHESDWALESKEIDPDEGIRKKYDKLLEMYVLECKAHEEAVRQLQAINARIRKISIGTQVPYVYSRSPYSPENVLEERLNCADPEYAAWYRRQLERSTVKHRESSGIPDLDLYSGEVKRG